MSPAARSMAPIWLKASNTAVTVVLDLFVAAHFDLAPAYWCS